MLRGHCRIDPSSLETSPKGERAAAAAEPGGKQQQQLPSVGHSPSPAPASQNRQQKRLHLQQVILIFM